MSHLEFNIKAKFVYTKLLPLVQEACRSAVDSLSYETSDLLETVGVHFANGDLIQVDVTEDSLVDLAINVLEAVG